MKKLFLFLTVAVLSLSLAACGGEIDYANETLTIWSFTEELEDEGDVQYFIDNFTQEGQKYEGMDIEYVVIPTEDYLTTILPALRAGSGAPDVFTGELDMLLNFMEADFLADLESLMEDDPDLDVEAIKADFVDYIWESGIDPYDGRLKSLSWQITPGAVFFKTDMAEAVWGDKAGFPQDDGVSNYNALVSDWMSENKFDSLQGLVDASEEVKAYDSTWRLFPNDDAIRWFSQESNDPVSWLAEDGLLNPERLRAEETYMEAVKSLYAPSLTNSLTANIGEWSGEWFQGMGKDFSAADGTTYQTMAYTLPTWGLFYVLQPNMEMDEDGNPLGNWGMASGPNSYFWGGTYLNIYKDSDLQEPAYDFVKSMLFDMDRMTERAENGDVYARLSLMEDVIADYDGNPFLGGINHYEYFLEEAEGISLDHITNYDRTLDEIMGDAVNDYKEGNHATLADAFQAFYQDLQGAHPQLYRESGLPYQD